MKIKPFRALYPVLMPGESPDAFCNAAKNDFNDYRNKGCYHRAEHAALYIYQIETPHNKRLHTGLVALNDIDAFFSGYIKQHEKTLSDREDHHVQLLLDWRALLKPVLLTYPAQPDIEALLLRLTRSAPPLLETVFESDAQVHRIWAIDNPEYIGQLQHLFGSLVNETYIADGHHRTTSLAALYRFRREQYPELDFEHLYCAYFSTEQLDISDFNRLIELPAGATAASLLELLAQVFDIKPLTEPRKPRAKHELTLLLDEKWYVLHWKKTVLNQYANESVLLDVHLLNEQVLRKIFGIADVRSDARIRYVDGASGWQGLLQAAQKTPGQAAFMLFPVAFDDMIRLADRGESLPPKSTYFEPRIKTGILVRPLDQAD